MTPQTPCWTPDELPTPSRDLHTLQTDLDEFGYCLIEQAIEPQRLGLLQQRLFEQAGAERRLHQVKNPANPHPANQWVGMLLNKGEVFFDLVSHDIATALFSHVLGGQYLVSTVDAQIQHPSSGAMPLHTDQWWMPAPVSPGGAATPVSDMRRGNGGSLDARPAEHPISAAMVANVMWMVTDFSEDNGCTRVVPRSHKSGRQPDPSVPHPIASVPVVAAAGTAFAFDGRLWHGAGANISAESRFGITTTCCGPQCRQLENYPRGLRAEVIARCSEQMLARLGFATWSSYGHTGDTDTRFTAPASDTLGELKLND